MKRIKNAVVGIIYLLLDKSFGLHIFGLILSIIYGIIIKLSLNQFLWILVCSSLVLISEAFNCVIEKLCDLYSKDYNPLIKKIKDMSAGIVLISVIFACIIALILLVIQYQGGKL